MKLLQVMSILTAAALLWGQSESALERAIRKETLEGDLKGAIESYKKLAQDKNRTVAAKALVHLGECYEKMGDSEARKAYEQVVRDFGDQRDAAAAAHLRLSALGRPGGGAGLSLRMVEGDSKNYLAGASPDGRYLLEASSEGLFRRDLASGQKQMIFKGPVGTAIISSDSSRIALTVRRPSMPEIWTVARDGGQQRKVWQGESGQVAHGAGWMPDGKRIVVQVQQGRTLSRLLMLSTEDGSATKIWEAPVAAYGPLSPDGAWVAVDTVSSNPKKEVLSLISTADPRETPILEEFGSIDSQQWTPDGKGLVFLSDRRTGKSQDLWYLPISGGKGQGRPELIQSDLDEASLAPITRDGTLYYEDSAVMREVLIAEIDPAAGKAIGAPKALAGQTESLSGQPIYSPDGRWILYRRGRESSVHVLRDVQSGEEKVLKTGFIGPAEATWFPDSRSILVNSRRPNEAAGFYRTDAATGSATLLKQGVFGAAFAISPDGKTVYYSRYSPNENQTRVMAWDTGSGSEREVMSGQGYPDVSTHWIGIALSPDGSHLATRRTEGQDSVIDIRPAMGGEKREVYRVHAPQALHELQWARDGRHLIFTVIEGERESLWRIPVSGGGPQEMGISARAMGKVVVSPDGRHIAFVAVQGGSRIMALDHFLQPEKH
jgi:Tol biopolymer transport system component